MGVHKVDAYQALQLKVQMVGSSICEGPAHGIPSSAYLRRFGQVTSLFVRFSFIKLFFTHPAAAWRIRTHVFALGPAVVELLLLGVSSSLNFEKIERFRALAGSNPQMSIEVMSYFSDFTDQMAPAMHKTLTLWNDGGVPRKWVVVAYSLAALRYRPSAEEGVWEKR